MKKVIYANHTLYDAWDDLYQFLPEDNGFTNLGSGSDYTAFLQLGIGALDFGFDADRNTPVYHYHSNYDSYHWMKTQIDPDFSIHAAAGQFITLLAYHLADDPLVPFDADTYARNVNYYIRDLVIETMNMRPDYGVLQRQLAIPELDAAAKNFRKVAQAFAQLTSQPNFLADAKKVAVVNKRLRDMQRVFVREEGLPGRPFYKNALCAPSKEDGYKAQMLPGSMEALREGDLERCKEWNVWLAGAIGEAAKVLVVE
jgi:N-acetylated-alpha-linked acidic dipeptidase